MYLIMCWTVGNCFTLGVVTFDLRGWFDFENLRFQCGCPDFENLHSREGDLAGL